MMHTYDAYIYDAYIYDAYIYINIFVVEPGRSPRKYSFSLHVLTFTGSKYPTNIEPGSENKIVGSNTPASPAGSEGYPASRGVWD